MQNKSVSHLVQALSDSERRELLERIQRSLSLAKKEQENIVHASNNPEQHLRLVQHDMHELSVWQRLVIWIRKIISGKTDEELFEEMKLNTLGKALEARKLIDISTKSLQPHFAELLLRVYGRIRDLADFFFYLWGSETSLMSAVSQILAHKIPNAKNSMYEFIDPDELDGLFEQMESKAGLRQELLERLNNYLDNIPASIFSEIEQGLLPLYYLKELHFFDFAGLYRSFQADLRAVNQGQKPEYKAIAASKVLDKLEELHYALYTALKGTNNGLLQNEIYDMYQEYLHRKTLMPDKNTSASDFLLDIEPLEEVVDEPEETNTKVQSSVQEPKQELGDKALEEAAKVQKGDAARLFAKKIKDLHKEIEQFTEQARPADIICYFKQDPWYRFMAYIPSLNLKEFYYASTRMKLLDELDQKFLLVREHLINKLKKQVFPERFIDFEFYRKIPVGFNRSIASGFRYYESLQILYNYTAQIFIPYVKDLLRVLGKAIPARARDSSGEFSFHSNGLETCHEQIVMLDRSFSPENAEGKNLNRLRMNLEKDPNQDRAYRIYLVQKEKDVKPILEQGIEHIRALAALLQDILRMPEEMINERVQGIIGVMVQGGYYKKLRGILSNMLSIQQAVRYQRALEEERL